MKKLKIYLDTSLISHLDAYDTLDKMSSTLKLWDEIKEGKYDVFISEIVISELTDCPEPKRSLMFGFLNNINYIELSLNDEVEILADKYIIEGIVP